MQLQLVAAIPTKLAAKRRFGVKPAPENWHKIGLISKIGGSIEVPGPIAWSGQLALRGGFI
jgi:hypothetical protein